MTFYRESQKFPPALWLLLLPVSLLMTFGAYQQLILDRPFGESPMPDGWMFSIWLIFGVLLPGFFYLLELRTEVLPDGVHARFYPLPGFGVIPFANIEKCYVRQFRPIMEYGGWGLRFSRHGTAYIMRGKVGVQLELKDGKKVLIGSQRSEELQQAIERAQRSGV